MSITAETAKQHAHDPAVLCCRAEAGITIGPENLEDPSIFDELVDSGLLSLERMSSDPSDSWCQTNKDLRLSDSDYRGCDRCGSRGRRKDRKVAEDKGSTVCGRTG